MLPIAEAIRFSLLTGSFGFYLSVSKDLMWIAPSWLFGFRGFLLTLHYKRWGFLFSTLLTPACHHLCFLPFVLLPPNIVTKFQPHKYSVLILSWLVYPIYYYDFICPVDSWAPVTATYVQAHCSLGRHAKHTLVANVCTYSLPGLLFSQPTTRLLSPAPFRSFLKCHPPWVAFFDLLKMTVLPPHLAPSIPDPLSLLSFFS